MAIDFLVSAAAIALGAFVVASPAQAARIWGSEKFYKLAPDQQVSLLLWWRVFGFLLCLGAVLFGADAFSSY